MCHCLFESLGKNYLSWYPTYRPNILFFFDNECSSVILKERSRVQKIRKLFPDVSEFNPLVPVTNTTTLTTSRESFLISSISRDVTHLKECDFNGIHFQPKPVLAMLEQFRLRQGNRTTHLYVKLSDRALSEKFPSTVPSIGTL